MNHPATTISDSTAHYSRDDGTVLCELASVDALFPSADECARLDEMLTRELSEADARVAEGAVMPSLDLADLRTELVGFDFCEPRPLRDLLSWTVARMESGLVHVTHPRYFGLFN